jgi:hypothetical protein
MEASGFRQTVLRIIPEERIIHRTYPSPMAQSYKVTELLDSGFEGEVYAVNRGWPAMWWHF